MRLFYILPFFLLALFVTSYAQDIEFHLNAHLLQGKNIIKVKRDFKDPYLWVLAQNNEVYRINSLNNTVEDFTSRFSAYQNFQFIDIAGRSKDTVFVATNSTNVLELKYGTLKVIGAANGIAGTVNSIGISIGGKYNGFLNSDYIAVIATTNGLCRFDYLNETMLPVPAYATSRIYESTYRNQTISDSEFGRNIDNRVEMFPVFQLFDYTIYSGEIWLGGTEYGHNIKSAFFTKNNAYGTYLLSTFANHFWATENGLFQNNWNYSYTIDVPSRHYLNGVDISKITSIYGLTAFGSLQSKGLVKENIIVGSSQGLYYSDSKYISLDDHFTAKYNFYHYDGLGSKAISDICVNATSYTTPICEDGVWVAAIDGLYLLKPDHSKSFSVSDLQAIQFKGQPSTISEIDLCANGAITANVNNSAYSGDVIQWYKDGQEIPAASAAELTITKSGNYSALLYDPCSSIKVKTNHLKVNVISAPIFTFNYPSQIQTCKGTPVLLTANGSANYQYRWYKNGVLNGTTGNTLSVNQDGTYKIEVSACNGNWVSSSEVKINSIELPQPVVTANKASYCAGEQAVLSAGIDNKSDYHITWLVDGTSVSEYDNLSAITTNRPGKYEVVVSSNTLACSRTAVAYNLAFELLPVLSIQKIGDTPLCNGETISLQAVFSSGNVKWSTGETSSTIQIKSSGIYSATIKTVAGCEINQSLNLQFFPKPKLNIPDATLCQFNNQKVTLTAPAGFTRYEWNGVSGTRNYTTSALGTVHLMVTDQNGCTATETININSYCDDIRMANTFTPNGDGINDTWTITGLENDASSNVKVFNRSGSLIFESCGYATPWNGTRNGQQLPAGSYYYLINTKNNKRVLSGTVTIIY